MNRLPSSGDDGQHREASTVDRWRDDVRALEAMGLRQPAGDRDGDEQPDQGHDVDEAPAAGAEVGERQRDHGDAGAESAGHRQHAHRVRARVARHLLGSDDGDEEVEGEAERPAERLGGDEHGNVGASAPAAAHDGAAKPTTTITRRRPTRSARSGDRQDEDDPGAHDRAGDADAGVADAEVVGGELDGLGEQRVDERRRHRRGGEQSEDARLPWRRAGRAAPTTGCGGPVDDRSAGSWPRRAIVQRIGRREQPAEPRQAEPIGRALLDRRAVASSPTTRSVVAERAGVLDEPAVAVGAFADEVVAWRARRAQRWRSGRPRPRDQTPVDRGPSRPEHTGGSGDL